jgi:hypothetical protein
MNPFQQTVARLTGIEEVLEAKDIALAEIQANDSEREQEWTERFAVYTEALEHLDSQNALLQRQIEDIDYLALFEIGAIAEVIPGTNRKATLLRLRRLRQENPLAKQAIKLIVRFTLGKGVEMVVGPDPEQKVQMPPLQGSDGEAPQDSNGGPKPGLNGLFPGNKPTGGPPAPANRPRPQIGREAVGNLPPSTGTLPLSSIGDDSLKDQITSFWKDADNQRTLTSRAAMQEWVDEVATDGEKFFIGFEGPAEPFVKLTEIPVEQIDTIIYDPDDWKKPVYYVRCWVEQVFNGESRMYEPKGQPKTRYYLDYRILPEELADLKTRIKIKAEELADDTERIFHSMINPLWTKKGKRGISELYASREWFRVYKEFMEDRAAINAAATSVAYKRKIKGGPAAVAQFTNKLGPLTVGYDAQSTNSEIAKLTRPTAGGIHDSNPAVDLEWMKTDTGAVNAKEDGRSLLMAAGSGVGMFVQYFGDGGDANLATAQAMELPMVKTFEDWQQWTEDALREMCFWVIRVASDVENAKKQIDRIAGSFPPIISQDVVKYMTAWSQLTQNVASGNRIVKRESIKGALSVMNVPNLDQLMNEIDAEEVQLEQQRQAQHQAMVDALANGGLADPTAPSNGDRNSNGNPKLAARDGSSNGLPGDLKTLVKGKPAPARNGPKPA